MRINYESRLAKWLSIATLGAFLFVGMSGGAFGAFWRANFPDFTSSDSTSSFAFGYGYGSLGWGYGYGYGYGYTGFNSDGVGYYYSASGISATGSTAFANPLAVTPDQVASVVSARGGNPLSTTGVTITQTVRIASQSGSSNARITLPVGVEIRTASGGAFSTANLIAADVSTGTTVTGFDTVRGAVSFGTGSSTLYFSRPIKVEIPVSGVPNGTIYVRVDHGSGYETAGLTDSDSATCTSGVPSSTSSIASVSSEIATIYTCAASTFAVVEGPTSESSSSSSSSSSSGGGGGGSGGSSSTKKDSCPNGDYSPSYYDSKCGTAPTEEQIADSNTTLSPTKTSVTETVTTPVNLVGTLSLEPQQRTDGTKSFVVTSGNGEITLRTNSDAELALVIPGNTVVSASSEWDGVIQAPLQLRNAQTESRGIMVVFAGNKNTSLRFSNPITLNIPVAYENGVELDIYSSTDASSSVVFHGKANVENGMVSFTTDHLSYFILQPSGVEDRDTDSTTFPDIAESFAQEYIEELFARGVINGYDDGTFRPESTATRAEFLKMALKGLGVSYDMTVTASSFADVNVDWQIPLIESALRMGIVSGQTVNGQLVFRPNDAITRAEAMKMLLGASGLNTPNFSVRQFTDITDDWQYEFVESAREYGIVSGQTVNGQLVFRPND
ncbi:MAG TPA: S-layer homology domain-containing protein, partial [bacterium]|nr:S-layer homology domain-containing protein [bacterium]